ncbi:MAG: carbonic anhydrase [Anaerovoracaceae bacterium]
MIRDIVKYNQEFVKQKGYERFITSKYPEKKLAILTCMDARLTELLPAALGIKNGDAKIIKNAGGIIAHPFGSVVRSLIIAIMTLGVNQIMVIGHTDCGVKGLDASTIVEDLQARGVSKEKIDMVRFCGVNFEKWLGGFDCANESIASTIKILNEHPLIPSDVEIKGFIMDSVTGELTPVD